MSDTPDTGTTEGTQEPAKQSTKADAALYLMGRRSPLTRNRLLLIASALTTVVLIGMIIGFSTAGVHPRKVAKQTEQHDFQPQPPGVLTAPIANYLPTQQIPAPSDIATAPPAQPVSNNVPAYNSYSETPTHGTVKFVNPNQQPAVNNTPTQRGPLVGLSLSSQPNPQELAQQRALTSLESPILYANESPAQSTTTNNGAPTAKGSTSGPYDSHYQKQNQAAEKQQFLASQQADYGAYLDNKFLRPVDPTHELMAGTIIPITMITGINSDNPGTIIAQVNHDVYDSITGTNILIPAGSRLIGAYDNAVAFGQNRVLVAWNRLIVPDGVSIELRGMPGADNQGQAGFQDKVDYHITQLLAGVSLATVFNVAQDIALSALTTAQFLNSVAQAMIANGQVSQQAGSETQAIVQQYANKLINQQPTITIRPGYNATVIVNKDIILPAYVAPDPYGDLP